MHHAVRAVRISPSMLPWRAVVCDQCLPLPCACSGYLQWVGAFGFPTQCVHVRGLMRLVALFICSVCARARFHIALLSHISYMCVRVFLVWKVSSALLHAVLHLEDVASVSA